MAASSRGEAGRRAEELAARFLADRGLAVVLRNFRCRRGEIDIIARDGEALVFVEVRLRSRSDFGDAAASISAAKRARIAAAAAYYLARFPRTPPCRIDALLLADLDSGRIEWLRNIMDV